MKPSVMLVLGLWGTVAAGEPPPAGPCQGQVRLEGAIAEIDVEAQQVTIATAAVRITDASVLRMGRNPIALKDLKPGQTVAVVGQMEDDVLVARQVNVKYRGQTDRPAAKRVGRGGGAREGRAWRQGMRSGRRAGQCWRCGAGLGRGQKAGRGRGFGRGPRRLKPGARRGASLRARDLDTIQNDGDDSGTVQVAPAGSEQQLDRGAD
ncbi:MAG: DUF5666 domain-containing protein [Planctomycetota bacterium]|jgi:hypothetical protein